MNVSIVELTFSHLAYLIPPLLLIEGFFSGSEIALLSADRLDLKRLARSGSRGCKIAIELLAKPERIFSTTLLVTSLCVICISGLISIYVNQSGLGSDLLSIAISSTLVVFFGELLPKTLYQSYSVKLVPIISYAVVFTYWFFYPITKILSFYTQGVSKLITPIQELMTGKKRTTRDELRSLIKYDQVDSELKVSERKMIQGILDFRGTQAKRALIPLVDVDAVAKRESLRSALEKFGKNRHSRMPVYSERIDNIIGVLEISEILNASNMDDTVESYILESYYAPESQPIEDVLIDMRRNGNELTVVVDEHGGAVGILTYEDIYEQIVGDIQDEYEPSLEHFKKVDENTWIVQAKTEIDRLNEELQLSLPQGNYETLSGFLLQQFGRIPEVQDELFFTTQSGTFRFVIRQANNRRIETILVERQPDPPQSTF